MAGGPVGARRRVVACTWLVDRTRGLWGALDDGVSLAGYFDAVEYGIDPMFR